MAPLLLVYLAGALLIPGRPLYTVLYLAGGVYLLARFSLEHTARRVQAERELSDRRIFLGETLTVTLRFRNPTAIPLPWLQYLESRPQAMVAAPFTGLVSLGAGETAEVSYTLHGVKRGRHLVGPASFATGDPFGIARVERTALWQETFTVYPQVVPLTGLGLPARLPMGDLATRRRLFEDPAWLAGTREYVPGDALRQIHWNATARTGTLMVKQFRHAMLLPCCVALNLNRADYDHRAFWRDSELAVTAAASLCHYLVEQKQQVALLATGIDPDETETAGAPVRLPLRQGRPAMVDVLEVLARIQAGESAPFAETVADEARRLPWGTLFCLVTPRETPAVAALCARMGHSGRQVLLFVTEGEPGHRPGYQVLRLSENRAGEVTVG